MLANPISWNESPLPTSSTSSTNPNSDLSNRQLSRKQRARQFGKTVPLQQQSSATMISSLIVVLTVILACNCMEISSTTTTTKTIPIGSAKSNLNKEFVNGETNGGVPSHSHSTISTQSFESSSSKVTKRSAGNVVPFPSQSTSSSYSLSLNSPFGIGNLERAKLFCQTLAAESLARNNQDDNTNHNDYYYYSNELMTLLKLLLEINGQEVNEEDKETNLSNSNIVKLLLKHLSRLPETRRRRSWFLINRHQWNELNELLDNNQRTRPVPATIQFRTIQLSDLIEKLCKSILQLERSSSSGEQSNYNPLMKQMSKKFFYYFDGGNEDDDDDSLSKKFDYLFANEGIRYKRNNNTVKEDEEGETNKDGNFATIDSESNEQEDNDEEEEDGDENHISNAKYVGGYRAYRLQYAPLLLRRMNWLRSVNEHRRQQSKKTATTFENNQNQRHLLSSSSPSASTLSPSLYSVRSNLPIQFSNSYPYSQQHKLYPKTSKTKQSKMPILSSNLDNSHDDDNDNDNDSKESSGEYHSNEDGNRYRRNHKFHGAVNPFAHEGIRFKKSPFQEEGIRFKKSPFQEEGIRFKKSPFQEEGIRFKKSPFQEEGIRFKKSPFLDEGIRYKKSPFDGEGIRYKKSPFQEEGIRFKKSPFQEEGIRFKKSPFEGEGIRYKKSPFEEEGIRYK